MRLIAGLGNPGTDYALTRHNVGWDVIDQLADRLNAGASSVKFGGACWGPLLLNGERVILLKPYTYMNNSGIAVGELVRFYRIEPANVLIVVDDINLPVGRMRIRASGSAGGHNGLKSIIAHLGTQAFPRLRIGVGSCPEGRDMAAWVTGHFSAADRAVVDRSIEKASGFCADWCSSDAVRLMSSINSCDVRVLNGEA
ncbi:MAG: aminoacyl-tRNA hydrolase [Pyramidobacter sp.]|nr:aminoacyl-tRNA hydrolase [Pyramidobacter sp.]